MAALTPILAGETTAAKLLDLKLDQFRQLVREGHLPRGREIAPGFERWDIEDLRRIASGGAADGGYEW